MSGRPDASASSSSLFGDSLPASSAPAASVVLHSLGTSTSSAAAAPMSQAPAGSVPWTRWVSSTLSAGSVVSTLVVYGLLQERVMAQPYGGSNSEDATGKRVVMDHHGNIDIVDVAVFTEGKYFELSLFLVLCNRLVAVAFAGAMRFASGEASMERPPMWKYFLIAFPNVTACFCQYEALKFVSYSVQMLGKSVRMLPSMFFGCCIDGRRYACVDWFIAISVAAGAVQYLTLGPIGSCKHPYETLLQNQKGFIMLLFFLVWDALASYLQDRLLSGHEVRTQRYGQVMHINLCAAIIAAGWLFASGAGPTAFRFCMEQPMFGRDAFLLSAAAVAGQWCIYSQVQTFGAAFFANTMTLRQLVSTFASYAWFKHPITKLQFSGLCCIFGALICKGFVAAISGASGPASAVAMRAAALGERQPLRHGGRVKEYLKSGVAETA